MLLLENISTNSGPEDVLASQIPCNMSKGQCPPFPFACESGFTVNFAPISDSEKENADLKEKRASQQGYCSVIHACSYTCR